MPKCWANLSLLFAIVALALVLWVAFCTGGAGAIPLRNRMHLAVGALEALTDPNPERAGA